MRAPLLLVHGSDDPRVLRVHSDALAEGLRKQGCNKDGKQQVEYVCYAGEGHGIRREANVLDMYRRVEIFLCTHLGLPPPPAIDEKWTASNTAETNDAAALAPAMKAQATTKQKAG
jgi:hypothetical protein